jgi:hydrogenase expression/formation protein HypE
VSGNLGDHHACILSARLGIENGIKSDCACLKEITDALSKAGIHPHTMRDVTRGGLATVLNEIANSSQTDMALEEESIPVTPEVKALCGILGLDPIYMGNEGKMIAIVPKEEAQKAVEAMKTTETGQNAEIIGEVIHPIGTPKVTKKTKIGGTRRIPVLSGEGLPRIC